MPPEPATGAPTVYVHVGEPKSGTTYLQQVLWKNRKTLREHGLLIPGQRPAAHWSATQDLREVEQLPNDPFPPFRGSWDRIVAQALSAPGKAIISHELLASVEPDQAERGVRSLGVDNVHVIITVRDIASLIPAEWQETIKHRNTRPWHDWVSDVVDRESISPDRRQWWFWRVHDTLEILRMWSALLSPERVHVVTVPRSGSPSDLLWQRFAQVLDIDPGLVDLTRARSNASLGLPETEFLRRVNDALPNDLPNWFYMRTIKDGLGHDALAARPVDRTERLTLPADREAWARKHAEDVVTGLRTAGYDIAGDLDELMPAPLPESAVDPARISDTQLVGASLDAVVHLVTDIARTQGIRIDKDGNVLPPPEPKQHSAIKRRLIELSSRNPRLHRIRRRYWDTANAIRRLRNRSESWQAVEDRNLP